MDGHEEAVATISRQLQSFNKLKEPFRIYHGSTNSTKSTQFFRTNIVDTSGFTRVLKIDPKEMTAVVEPSVCMEQLVRATLARGFVPPVVMEFPGITVGGGFCGMSFESSSYKHGLFQDTICAIEIVLADGEIVHASPTERADLFQGAAGSFGTLGVVTLLAIRLVPASQYVELSYTPFQSWVHAMEIVQVAIKDPAIDFVDGIMFSLEKGTIMSGRLTNKKAAEAQVQRFTRARDQWFYREAEKWMNHSPMSPRTTIIRLEDYLFRYDRGAFFTGKYAFQYFLTPFNRVTRFLLDPFMHTKTLYHAFHASGLLNTYIVQDVAVPLSRSEEFIKYCDQAFSIYPLWLCPLKARREENFSIPPVARRNGCPEELLINVGIWGPSPHNYKGLFESNRAMEKKIDQLSGSKCMYAQVFFTEEEFWNTYDRRWYDSLRAKYKASALPDVYSKVRTDFAVQERAASNFWSWWPLAGVWGILQVLLATDYLLAKKTHP
ncbi:hypothetical protein MMC25_001636 [Agyrium rufum]|nr:hypothetical protein [Agyrium rufum]